MTAGSRSLDFRTDALTEPTEEMWQAMRAHEYGWALRDEDEAVLELEAAAAALTGKESALFCLSGSLANLVALMTLTTPGSRVVLVADSHIMCCEDDGIGYVCGAIPHVLPGAGGRIDPDELERALTHRPFGHRPDYRLLCLENTHNISGGMVLPGSYTRRIGAVARAHDLRVHLDGARLLNAAVATGETVSALAEGADTVTVNLNKGLSAPFGALLCGPAEVISRARTNRSRAGAGSMSKAGIFAAAGLVGLRTMVPQLARDHANAALLAGHLADVPGLWVDPETVQTNIVKCHVDAGLGGAHRFASSLAARGVRVHPYSDEAVRFVTHRQVTEASVAEAAGVVAGAARELMPAAPDRLRPADLRPVDDTELAAFLASAEALWKSDATGLSTPISINVELGDDDVVE